MKAGGGKGYGGNEGWGLDSIYLRLDIIINSRVYGLGGAEEALIAGVADAGAMGVVGGAQVRGGRPRFLSLPLSRPKPGVRSAISDLYK